jgi:hypothetical protein
MAYFIVIKTFTFKFLIKIAGLIIFKFINYTYIYKSLLRFVKGAFKDNLLPLIRFIIFR